MYKCPECGAVFEEPNYEKVDMEAYNGVSGMFAGPHHYATFASCPECGGAIDTEYDTYDEEEDDDELQ